MNNDTKKFRAYRISGRYSIEAPIEYHIEVAKKDDEYYEQMEEDITCFQE